MTIKIDQPLEYGEGDDTERFLKCEYNRNGDSFRSHWTNKYYPPIEDDGEEPPYTVSGELQVMEDYANQLMREYVKLYFGFCISSVYFFETTDTGFGACFLVKKDIDNEEGLKEGVWDSIHSFTVDTPADGKQTSYTLVSTIYMHLKSGDSESGSF